MAASIKFSMAPSNDYYLLRYILFIMTSEVKKSVLYYFHDTSNPTNIYGNSRKLHYMISATLTIQWTYMVDLGYYRELSCHIPCTVWCSFLSLILINDNPTKLSLMSLRLVPESLFVTFIIHMNEHFAQRVESDWLPAEPWAKKQ